MGIYGNPAKSYGNSWESRENLWEFVASRTPARRRPGKSPIQIRRPRIPRTAAGRENPQSKSASVAVAVAVVVVATRESGLFRQQICVQ